MKLIIGGKYQGKLEYGIESNKLNMTDVFNCTEESIQIDENMKIINNFQNLILALVKENIDPTAYIEDRYRMLDDKIVICDDLSCGVVPIDPVLRSWREAVGRSLVFLANKSDEVTRVFCGLPMRLK